MTGPEIREELGEIIKRLQALQVNGYIIKRLKVLKSEMKRRPAIRRAPTTRARATPALKKILAREARANPDVPLAVIGRRYNVDGGRVSEAVHGKRT
jgi:hypothetical protein